LPEKSLRTPGLLGVIFRGVKGSKMLSRLIILQNIT